MRLRRLDLTRFGRFTDFTLDFGPRPADAPDMHVIFGPNEAGKTTSFEAFLDLLYGIPTQSPYNFLHDYNSMEIGGLLEIDGQDTPVRRIKKQKNALLDADGQPLGDGFLQAALAGITRDQYKAMFSLDDETIEEGGEDILASGGDLGELLFSAAAGLSDLGSDLRALQDDCERFHKPRARKTELAEAKRALDALKSQIRDSDLSVRDYKRLRDTHDKAQEAEIQSRRTRDTLLAEQTRLLAMKDALPLRARLDDLTARLAPLADLPEMPEDTLADIRTLRDEDMALRTRQDALQQRLLLLERQRDEVPRDPAVLANKGALAQLPRDRAATAAEDLPKRRSERDALDDTIRKARHDLGLTDDAPSPTSVALAQAESAARTLLDAEAEALRQTRARDDAEDTLRNLGDEDTTPEPTALEDLIETLAPARLAQSLQQTERVVAEAEAVLHTSLTALSPWQGGAGDLPATQITRAHLHGMLDDWQEARARHAQARDHRADAKTAAATAAARLTALTTDLALVTDETAAQTRAARDALWRTHRTALDTETAEAFEASLAEHDGLQSARLAQADRLAQLRETQAAAAEAQARLTLAEEAANHAAQAQDACAHRLSEIAQTFGLDAATDPRALTEWYDLLASAHAARDRAARARTETRALRSQAAEAANRLRAALDVPDTGQSLDHLTRQADAALRTQTGQRARAEERAKARTRAEQTLAAKTKSSKDAQDAVNEARTQWDTLCAALPAACHAPDVFLSALPHFRDLRQNESRRDELHHRIAAMEEDAARFSEQVTTLSQQLGTSPADTAFAAASALDDRLTAARNAEALYAERTAQITSAEEEQAADLARRAQIDDRLAELARPLKQPFPDAEALLDAAMQARTATDLRRDTADLEQQIVTRLDAADIADARRALDGATLSEIEARLAAVAQDLSAAQEALDEAIGDLRLARKALDDVGRDDEAARLTEQRETALTSLTDAAMTHLRLRLGRAAAETALARYRDTHRSGMLTATSRAFAQLTDGHYNDLQTRTDGQREVLLAMRTSDGRSVEAAEMSKGTRFQLYLALRLAGYREYAAKGISLPFIADDIMETFDNTRTRAALSLLREMGRIGQALYFTHHEHVVDLARETCGPDLKVHEIPRRT